MGQMPPTYTGYVRTHVRANLKLYGVTGLEKPVVDCVIAAGIDISARHATGYNQLTARRVAEVVVTAYLWPDHPIHFFVEKYVKACKAGDADGPVIGLDLLNPEELKAYKRWVKQFWG